MVNNISEHELSKSNAVLVKNFPGATNEKIPEKMGEIFKEKLELSIIIYAGTNI